MSKLTAGMKEKRRAMEKTLMVFFIVTIAFVMLLILYLLSHPEHEIIILECLALFPLAIICNQVLRHEVRQYQNMHHDGRKLLSEMIKIIDWTAFRKRQLYHSNDLSAIDDINMFLMESQRSMSPVKDGVKYNQLMALMLNVITLGGIVTILVLNKQDIKDFIQSAMSLV